MENNRYFFMALFGILLQGVFLLLASSPLLAQGYEEAASAEIFRYFRSWVVDNNGELRRTPDLQSRELVYDPADPPDVQLAIGSDSDGSFVEVKLYRQPISNKAQRAELIIHSGTDTGYTDRTERNFTSKISQGSHAEFVWRVPGLLNSASREAPILTVKFYDENSNPITTASFQISARALEPGAELPQVAVDLIRLAKEHGYRHFQANRHLVLFVEEGLVQVQIYLVSQISSENPDDGTKVKVDQVEVIRLRSGEGISIDPAQTNSVCFFSLKAIGRSVIRASDPNEPTPLVLR